MKSFVSSLALVASVNAQACTVAQRESFVLDCAWEYDCTVVNGEPTCATEKTSCAVTSVLTDCANSSFRCIDAGAGL
jgi:hypothetical protein